MEYDLEKNKISGWMNQNDLLWLFNTAQEMESIAEIGSWKGRSTHALLSGCKGTVYAVDHFLGSIAEPKVHAEAKIRDIHQDFMNNVGSFKNLQVIKMGSMEAVRQFEDNSVDMVFIDGGHTYEEVLADIKAWLPKTKKMICGHDRGYWEVEKAVKEVFGDSWEGNPGRKGTIWTKRIQKDVYSPSASHQNTDVHKTIPGINAFEYIVNKFKVDVTKPSPAYLPIGRENGFPELLQELGIKKGVEIGVYKGKYSEVIMRKIPELDLTAVDSWKSYPGYEDYDANDLEVNAYNQALIRSAKMGFKILKEWSVPASKQFADESLDFIYIDCNRDFAHVIEDLAAWSPKVKKGGIISGHCFSKNERTHYGAPFAVPAWCAYVGAKMLFVINGDKVPSWFYVKI